MDEPTHWAKVAVEGLIQRSVAGSRYTQDSPVLADVWMAFGAERGRHDLLLVPNWSSSAAVLASQLGRRLQEGAAKGADRKAAEIAYGQSTVAAKLTFEELVWAAIPLTRWYHHYLVEPDAGKPAGDLLTLARDASAGPHVREALLRGLRGDPRYLLDLDTGEDRSSKARAARHITGDLIWFVQLVGTLERILAKHGSLAQIGASKLGDVIALVEAVRSDSEAVLDAFLGIFDGIPPPAAQEPLWSAHLNRSGNLAMTRSTATVKADAARTVFKVTGAGVRWAVVDSGMDATHFAFRKRSPSGDPEPDWRKGTRVVATYDFSRARKVLSEHAERAIEAAGAGKEGSAEGHATLADLPAVEWTEWGERLRIQHDINYVPPKAKHGTHVAGILGADWRSTDDEEDALAPSILVPDTETVRTGMCPGIELYDIRVTDEEGKCDEFSLIAALQFIRAFNAKHDHIEIAGVNLSLSILHDVANFACGRTPVCEECERLVAAGIVVVAAAGNQGRVRYLTSTGEVDDGYRSISITDPGNAPSAITVGATHRQDPHGYGVSYFSSRGPTGDGRMKPDLVAPGEKVVSTVPGNQEEAMDGTSMAAPHVSGAAALLLARHPELKGRPAEIKRILCSTAIDLGRERQFQGAGLLDVLHALESI